MLLAALDFATSQAVAGTQASSAAHEHKAPTDRSPAADIPMSPGVSLVNAEDADCKRAVAACKQRPLSERTTCLSRRTVEPVRRAGEPGDRYAHDRPLTGHDPATRRSSASRRFGVG